MSTPDLKKSATRVAILEAAAQLFAELATEQSGEVTMEQIARRASVTRRTIYTHFESRTALLVAMAQYVDEKTGGLQEHLRQLREAPSALEALEIALAAPGVFYPLAYPLAKLFLGERYRDQAMRMAWDDRMRARHEICTSLVHRLQEDGVLAPGWDVQAAIDVLWVWGSWQVWEQLVIELAVSQERYNQYLRATVYRLLVESRF